MDGMDLQTWAIGEGSAIPDEALAALGGAVLATVAASVRLGHANVRHTAVYMHPGDDQTARFVLAFVKGETTALATAADEWLSAARSK